MVSSNSNICDLPVYLDVGANRGETSLQLAGQYRILAFEPVLDSWQWIKQQSRDLPHYTAYNLAISDRDGLADFHVNVEPKSRNYRYGVSSLLTMHNTHGFTGRTFLSERTERIAVRRLDTFLTEQAIERVDVIHVDTQGQDLAVLRGLGEYIHQIRRGDIEVATEKTSCFYAEQDTVATSLVWLAAQGFQCCVTPNDSQGVESVINFHR